MECQMCHKKPGQPAHVGGQILNLCTVCTILAISAWLNDKNLRRGLATHEYPGNSQTHRRTVRAR